MTFSFFAYLSLPTLSLRSGGWQNMLFQNMPHKDYFGLKALEKQKMKEKFFDRSSFS